jgi:hypothetical protein
MSNACLWQSSRRYINGTDYGVIWNRHALI